MDSYRIPTKTGASEYVDKRSRFLGLVQPVGSEEEARAVIAACKKQYHDARHNCWCYILKSGQKRYSDDGEPSGTAGMPIIEVMKARGVVDCAVVVTRYFGGILLGAEKKQIDVQVDCPEHLEACHDRKWTGEALFNILDNAVKYTPTGGQIHVQVEAWEMYLKIDIADTGIGIPEQHQGTIFKRFYREDAVHDVEGIGIGLYLAREIISLQGGYIRVASEVGKGSVFSVFLLRK